jgi:hypothetical protein
MKPKRSSRRKYPDNKLLEIADLQKANETAAAEALIQRNEQELTTKFIALVAKGNKALKDKQYARS